MADVQLGLGEGAAVVDADLRVLHEELATSHESGDLMSALARFMTPAWHHTPAGLEATRLYARLLQ